MHENVYVSTGAFASRDIRDIMELSRKLEISNIELSSAMKCPTEYLHVLEESKDRGEFSFLIHNYFPAPEAPFVLGLASIDEHQLRRSLTFCKSSIDLAERLGSKFYSVHAGYCFCMVPEHMGNDVTGAPSFSKEEGQEIFINSIKELSSYAEQKSIEILIENNVVASFNLTQGENQHFLGATSSDMRDIIDGVDRDNVAMLLDVGHLRVSAMTLEFSPTEFISDHSSTIRYVHLSDNDGLTDQNAMLSDDSWFWQSLSAECSDDTVYVLESYALEDHELMPQVELIQSMIRR